MRIALIGDGQSPHLLKWARALAAAPDVELWALSSRGFLPGFDTLIAPERRLALGSDPAYGGGNVGLLATLPRVTSWLKTVDADWLHAHFLTSHGTLAWLAKRLGRLRARIVGSAWGSDILVTPDRSRAYDWLTRRLLAACTLTTSDSRHMTERMRALGAGEVMTFPFGLDAMPQAPPVKDPWLFFANRALERLYAPRRVIDAFAAVAAAEPQACLVVANDGSMADELGAWARKCGLSVGKMAEGQQVEFTGRLDALVQAAWYGRARWYLSLPESDSVSVSVLEAMAHGCIPLLSDLPANRELVEDGQNGLIVETSGLDIGGVLALSARAERIATDNRAWIAQHGLFAPHVARFLERLRELQGA